MVKMINKDKYVLEDTLRTNDTSRKEERVRAVEEDISIWSDQNSDSESSDTSSEPATSSSKESKILAKLTHDNEETILDHGHQKKKF